MASNGKRARREHGGTKGAARRALRRAGRMNPEARSRYAAKQGPLAREVEMRDGRIVEVEYRPD